MTVWMEIGIIAVLILVNGFLAMSELAVVSSRRARLQALSAGGSRGARRVLALLDDSGRFLSTVQIGITLVGVLAGAFSGATLATRFAGWLATAVPGSEALADEIALTVIVGAITYLSLIVGELVPKQVALANPERMAILAAGPMRLVSTIAAPLVWVLDVSSNAVLRALRVEARDSAHSEEELKAIIGESTAAGVLAPEEQEMMRAVMRFADRKVRTIMTPRRDIDWLDVDASPETLAERLHATKHSRYPVCQGDIHHVLGVVQAKDLLDRLIVGQAVDLRRLARDVLAVPETAGALGVLEQIKHSPIHMALVVDEYGSVEGVVTASDILSDLVGGLSEHGQDWQPQAIRRDDGSWLIDGDMDATLAGEVIGHPGLGGHGRYATLAGFLLAHVRTLPTAGESILSAGWRFEVIDMDGRRIDKVLVVPPPPPEDEGDG